MQCTHFFKPLTCPVWTVGSMGLGAYSQQLSVQEPFYPGSNDWQNFLTAHYAASFSCFSAHFWELRWSFSDGFFSTHHHLPHCLVATLSGSSVNSHQVLNWVICRDLPSEDWMAQSWGGLTFLFQSLQSQRWTGQIEISTNGYVWECTHCDSRERCCAKLWGNQTKKLQVETLFHLGTLKRSSKKKLPQMSHEPSV